jgi:hypothetical protein
MHASGASNQGNMASVLSDVKTVMRDLITQGLLFYLTFHRDIQLGVELTPLRD